MPRPAAPAGLGARGRKLWREITSEWTLRPDERAVLEDACRERDLIEQMEAAQADQPLIAVGSQGQPVAAPLVQELRQHRAVVARLLAQLRLPDEGGTGRSLAEQDRTSAARKAALARWRPGSVPS